MSYAEGRLYYDADSHIMETSNWLIQFADPGVRELLRPLYLGGAGKASAELLAQVEGAGETSDESQLMTAKAWAAMGSIEARARTRALDLLGFDAQLVFSTFAATQFAGGEPELVYGGARAHNRGMAAFCSDDKRLLAVGYVPWGAPELVIREATAAIDDGCAAIMVDSAPPRDISPFHVDYEPLWALLADRNVPFVLHVGGGGSTVRRSYWKNGRPKPTDMFGGGESIRSKDYVTFHQAPEAFLSIMVLDGVLERFPTLQGGCIEQGATWVPGLLERVGEAQRMFSRTEPQLEALPMDAADYVRRQLWFTPFPGEPVGNLIDQAGEDLFMFSSDYPHPEGGVDPLGKFEATMGETTSTGVDKFYSANFAAMMGASLG